MRIKVLGLALLAVAIGALSGASTAGASGPPSVTTEAATSIGVTEATLNATINPNGAYTEYWFGYAVGNGPVNGTESYFTKVSSLPAGTTPQKVSVKITNLNPSKVYEFAAIAQNNTLPAGAVEGATLKFATQGRTVICSTAGDPCLASNTAKPAVEASASSVVIENSTSNVECSGSSLSGETSAGTGGNLNFATSALSLDTCKSKSGTSCKTASAVNLPYAGTIAATSGGNGTLNVANGGSGKPGIQLTCGFLVNCTFSFEPALDVNGGNPGQIVASKEALTPTSGGFCPETASFSGTYTINSPNPAYVLRTAPETVLCAAQSNGYGCASENVLAYGTTVAASASKVTINTSAVNVECSESSLSGKTGATSGTSQGVNSLGLSISSLPLGACKTVSGTTCKTGAAVNLPYSGTLESSWGNDGTLNVANGGSGKPGIQLTCGFLINCTFSFEPALDVNGGNPGQIVASKEALTPTSGGSCPETASFSGTYAVSSPNPLYVGLRMG